MWPKDCASVLTLVRVRDVLSAEQGPSVALERAAERAEELRSGLGPSGLSGLGLMC